MGCVTCGHANREGAKFCEECGGALSATAVQDTSIPVALGGGRYTPKTLLGEGARKRVYLALDERLGREVAVAVVKTDGLDESGRVRLAREARSMARLGDHPSIVTVFDVGEEPDGTPYIVSQLMPGGSLADRLDAAEAHRLPIADAIAVGEQIALALEHAHALSIVHRDLKPANVWFGADGSALLGDFGLAVPLDASRITSEGMVVGTVAYLAPEQALGRDPDPRADLYALGAVLYELVCGRPPFVGADAVAVISQHLNTAPVTPSWHNAQVPPAFESLIVRLLAKDPAERPANATEVIAQLGSLRHAAPAVAPTDVATIDRSAALEGDFSGFIGRVEELTQLQISLDEAMAGRSRIVMVVGEPGIGKTRLVEQLCTYAAMRGAQVCWGHSYEGEVGVPYLPFVEALRGYVHARSDDELRAHVSMGGPEVATLVSELRERFPDLPALPSLEGDAERLRLFEGVAAFVRGAAADQPLVLVLDDVHWADKPTLLLLQHLARTVRRERLLILGTYRDVELDRTHPLAETIANLRRQHLYERVLLRGLPANEVKDLIESVGGQEPPEGFADLVHRETEGNPFFVSEILRHLRDTGAIHREGDDWVGTPESVMENLPEGVREVIGRRLDHLTPECNEMLTVASAMTAGFTVELVGDVAEVSDTEMLDLLDEALSATVVRERRERPGTYEFGHALIRQTLYAELSTPRRVRLHRKIAEALEERYADRLDLYLNELAYHAFQGAPGGDVDRAVDYATRAGDRAMRQTAYEEAARSYDMALQALDHAAQVPDEQRAELLLRLGHARHRSGEFSEGRAACREAADAARRCRNASLLGRAAV